MEQAQAVESWLQKKVRAERAKYLLGAAGLLFLAALVLFATYWLVYLVLYFGFEWLFPGSHVARLVGGLIVLVLLFIGNATTDRRYLETYSFTTGTSYGRPVTIHVPMVGGGSTINPLAPESVHSFAKFITGLLFTGPRWATEGVRLVGRERRLAGLDVEGCAAVLAALAKQDGVIPFAELVPVIPAEHDLVTVFTQVQYLDGVRTVRGERTGLMLLSDLRSELRRAVPLRRKKKAGPRENETAAES
jgi:hypothetical protein